MVISPYQYDADLDRVIDGDTVILRVRLGFYISANITFRLLGINAPEVVGATREAGLAARANLEMLLGQGEISVVSTKYDKYAPRWLGTIYVHRPDGTTTNVNNQMVAMGHAIMYSPG